MKGFKYLVIISIVLFFQSEVIFSQLKDEILWEDAVKLKWEDFKGKAPEKNTIGLKKAETYYAIELDSEYVEGQLPYCIIKVFFIKNKSWTITNNKEVLAHEQLHFNIGELFARKIRQRFIELNIQGIKDYNLYNDEFNNFLKQERVFQEKYDKEVFFNSKKQLEWKTEITKQLEELKEYKLHNSQ